jgi:hypothetical protein
MFLSGAIFNWAIGIGLFFFTDAFLSAFFVAPTPQQSVWVQLFAGLVFVFGVGYYWAARDLSGNLPIVRLGTLGKSFVVLIALLNVIRGDISWQLMLPASVDAVYVALFAKALKP